jgi:hypothetical protein
MTPSGGAHEILKDDFSDFGKIRKRTDLTHQRELLIYTRVEDEFSDARPKP